MPGALVERHDKVHEIHRVEIERLAQIFIARQGGEIGLRRDAAKDVVDHGPGVGFDHSLSGSCNSRSIAVRRRAPMCPSVTRWSAARLTVTSGRGLDPAIDDPRPD